jgi:hypothetical protein
MRHSVSLDRKGAPTRRPIGYRRTQALLHRQVTGAGAVLLIAAFGTDYAYYKAYRPAQ